MNRKFAVIGLHGRGQSVTSIRQLITMIGISDIEIIVPEATGGTWYPRSFLAPLSENEPHLSNALATIETARAHFLGEGYQRSQIVLVGFSQGAALACEFVGRSKNACVGGVVAWHGGRIGPPTIAWPEADGLYGVQVLLTGGDVDPFVPADRTRATVAHLQKRGATVASRIEDRPHAVDQKDLQLARDLLVSVDAHRQLDARSLLLS